MKIYQILDVMIDPRPEIQRRAVAYLIKNQDCFARCQKFMNTTEEGYGGYEVDEIRLKWEKRIAGPYYVAMRAELQTRFSMMRAELQTRFSIKSSQAGHWLELDGRTIAGPFEKRTEARDVISRAIFAVLCGLDPATAV